MKKLILNRIQTPDGTILTSHHVHDYVDYTDKNGQYYAVDGGLEYAKRSFDKPDYKDLCVYEDAPFEVIRESFHRGGRGKDGKQPLTWTPMSKMSNSWLKACIDYNMERNLDGFANSMYRKELEYRAEKNIYIED